MVINSVLLADFKQMLTYSSTVNFLYGTRWLITGATGMIGSYFLSFLSYLNDVKLNHSMSITVFHRNHIGENHQNIGHLIEKEYINFIKVDLGTEFIFQDADSYDFIVHAASNAAPNIYLNDPIGTINTNVRTTQNLLEHVKESKRLKAFLYFGSGEIYGNPDIRNIPTVEDYAGVTNHLGPRSCYVESKRFAETLCWNYMKEYNIPVKIIRPVHVYGPGFRENDSRVWADFIIRATLGKTIVILGDGLSRRGFCYLSDAVLQMLAVIQQGNMGEVYNIGNDTHISIKELADIIARKSESKVAVEIKNQLPTYLQGSPEVSCPSISKVKQLMPILNTNIEDGIEKSLTWFLSLQRNHNEV